jgi:hypothetical protein
MLKAGPRFVATSAFSIGLVALASGCPDREVSRVDPAPALEKEKLIPVEINRDLDILFVIDNSQSMSEEQQSLAENFIRFTEVLENIEGGLPNIHLGVVSSDVGAGSGGIQNCSGNGDNGVLQAAPQVSGCSPPSGAFISDTDADEDGTRERNYSGSLAETFSCIAQLGITGCGFEQHLEAMRRALNGSNPANANFLRESAFLAVIFIADEDDCSTADADMFDTSQTSISSELGPLSSFRCFEFGVECEPDSRTVNGPRENCAPREDSEYMYGIQEYVDFLRSLKSQDPGLLITAGIIGDPEPVSVGRNNMNIPELQPSCVTNAGEAAPAIRLTNFLGQFPNRSTVTTICNEDLTDALLQIADLLAEVIGNPCLEGNLKTDDQGVPICTVMDRTRPDTDTEEQTVIPHCDGNGPGGDTPCWYTQPNTEDCVGSQYPLGVEIVIDRGGATAPVGTYAEVRCEAESL